jgi:hypothetical protein
MFFYNLAISTINTTISNTQTPLTSWVHMRNMINIYFYTFVPSWCWAGCENVVDDVLLEWKLITLAVS